MHVHVNFIQRWQQLEWIRMAVGRIISTSNRYLFHFSFSLIVSCRERKGQQPNRQVSSIQHLSLNLWFKRKSNVSLCDNWFGVRDRKEFHVFSSLKWWMKMRNHSGKSDRKWSFFFSLFAWLLGLSIRIKSIVDDAKQSFDPANPRNGIQIGNSFLSLSL